MTSRQQRDMLGGIFTGAFATTLAFSITTSPRLNLLAAQGGRAVGFALGRGGRAIGIGLRGGARLSKPVAFRASHIALKTGAKVIPVGGRFLGRSGAFTFRRALVPVLKAQIVLQLLAGTITGSFRFGGAVAEGQRGVALAQTTITGFVAGLTGFSESRVREELFGTTRGQIGAEERRETGVRGAELERKFLTG